MALSVSSQVIEPFAGTPDIQRLKDCMKGKSTDRVPHLEVLIEDEHVQRLLGRFAGNTLGVGGDTAKGNAAAESVVRPMHAADYMEICRIIGQDAMIVEQLWTPLKHRRPDGSVGAITDHSIKSREDLKNIIWPDESDMEERLQYIREYVAAARGTGTGVMFLCASIFQTLYEFIIGMSDCMMMVYNDRDLLEELMARSADYFAELVRRTVGEGVDILYAADDFAFKSGLFVPPALFKEIWAPHYDRILAPAREAGVPILFHSDGRLDDAVDMLIDLGVDAITPMDPSGIDYRDYKKRYGHRVTLHGNIDIAWPLATGTPEEVEQDVREHMEVLKPGGRWIAGSSHSIVNYVPHENFVAMINAIHRYGKY